MESSNIRRIIECVLFGMVCTTVCLYTFEIQAVKDNYLQAPRTTGIIADLTFIALLAIPGHQGLARIIPQGNRRSRIALLTFSLAPSVLAFLISLASHAFRNETGNMLSFGILVYGISNMGGLAKMTSPYLAYAVPIMVMTVLFAGFTALAQRARRPLYHLMLASPLLAAIPVLVNATASQNEAEMRWYQSGHLSFLIAPYLPDPETVKPVAFQSKLPTIYQPPVITSVQRKPNIIVLILESTRAKSVGPQADGKPSLTPFLDQLAATSLNIRSAYTSTDHTSKALVGILCGMYPNPDYAATEATPNGMKPKCLADLLAKQGYSSLFLQSAPLTFENRQGLTANMGYPATQGQADLDQNLYAKIGYLGMDDRALIRPAMNWMQKQEKPFLLTILTTGTHHPYQMPSAPEEAEAPIQGRSRQDLAPAYEATVRYADQVIKELFDQLDQAALLKDTVVIITGDHGEAFGEHGIYTHNGVPYTEVMQVPLMIHYPARYPQGEEITGLRQHVDIVPTVLDLMGAQWHGLLPGKSLLASAGHDQVVSHCWGPRNCLAMYSGSEMLAYFYGNRTTQRFDLQADPEQKSPLPVERTASAKQSMLRTIRIIEAIDQYWR